MKNIKLIIISIFILMIPAVVSGQTITTNVCESGQTECTEAHQIGDVVTLTAEPDPGWYFSGWLTDIAGCSTGECTFTVKEIKQYRVRAIFAQYPHETLHVYVFGKIGGKVATADGSMSCEVKDDAGSYCEASFLRGAKVVLTATPATAGKFTWRGLGCSGSGTCTTTMTKTKAINVKFY